MTSRSIPPRSSELLHELMDAGMQFSLADCDKIDAAALKMEGERYRLREQIANDTAEIAKLTTQLEQERGENAVLVDILRDCYTVIDTIEPENDDESDRLHELLMCIGTAVHPYKKGTLL